MRSIPQAGQPCRSTTSACASTEWRFAPGAETGEHVHQMDYVVVPARRWAPEAGFAGRAQESFAELKQACSYFRKAGVHHNVINANDFEYAFVEIELKS